jgi:hypothetical protein
MSAEELLLQFICIVIAVLWCIEYNAKPLGLEVWRCLCMQLQTS